MTDQQLRAWELQLQQARDVVTANKYSRELAEIERHNLAYETETQRHNRATEDAALQQIGVSWHQAHSSRMTAEANKENAAVNRQNALTNAWNAAINERNAAVNERNASTNWYNAETNRQKLSIDWYNADTNRQALGPAWLSAQGAYLRGQAGIISSEAAMRNAEYNYALGQLNYGLGMYRAETDRYGTIMNAGSNRMQAEAQKQNAQTRVWEYTNTALTGKYQRDLLAAQAEQNKLRTSIDREWGYKQAKANAYSTMADAMYKSELTDMESQKWASSTALGIIGAATRVGNLYGQGYDKIYDPAYKINGSWMSEDSGIWLNP